MKDKDFLMIPGPTPVPESVLLAMAKHPIGHRSSEFSKIVRRVEEGLKWVFQTKYDVQIYTSSGTGAMESAISNLVNEGDKVLSLIIGNFGARWAKIAAMRGAIVEKLKETGAAYDRPDGYLKFSTLYNPDFQANYLKENGFTQKQIEAVMPIYKKSRQAHMDARFSLKNPASDYPYELVEKMKEAGIIHNNKKLAGEFIYWKETFANETDIRNKLGEKGFEPWEIELIVDNWRKYNLTGFDLSGLKHISPKMAVYGFSDKLNNWTQEATNWITNSTAPTSSEGITPFVGVSMVQMDEDEIVPMSKIRSEEKLHAHPNLEEKRQTEIYLITSGAAALNVVKGGKSQVKILREGELAVVGPGVLHSINSISGEYEHIVSQVPSAFQYGFGFKQIVEPPQDYDEERLGQEAFEQLSECRNS